MSGIDMDRTTEALVILAEECCETGQIISKILRWGLDSTNNGALDLSNRDHLVKEIGDIMAMIDIVRSELGITDQDLDRAVQAKREKLKIYSRHF